MLQKLKKEFVDKILGDQLLQAKIAKLFSKKNIVTVARWAKANSVLLTTPGVLQIIREHEGLSQDAELIETLETVNVETKS